MDQFTLNLLFVGASFALYIGIAIWARAGSTSEFYAAGRGVLLELLGAGHADDHARHAGVAQAPGQGELCHAYPRFRIFEFCAIKDLLQSELGNGVAQFRRHLSKLRCRTECG